jgi:hydroxymethylpyrimidine/phosphomethylpyrimidine kinase
MIPRVLIIAGSDSGGGAGIQADIKTVTMLGGHAMTAITAITAQNTLGVQGVHPVPTAMVIAQMDAVASDIGVDAVKIGMIGSAETAEAVADWLERYQRVRAERREAASSASGSREGEGFDRLSPNGAGYTLPIVFDPVMIASSGARLADAATIAAFERLMRIATLTTPNLPELEALGGDADAIVARTGQAVLVKGGHGDGPRIVDRLVTPEGEMRFTGDRIDTRHNHGTGCTLASAIATGLARGDALPAAILRARTFVRTAMLAAPGLGAGHGPMGQGMAATGAYDLNQVTLPASDYAASIAFYRALGLVQIVDSPDHYARFVLPGGATLSIETDLPPAGGAHIYLECDDLDARVAGLVDAGIAFDDLPVDQSWGWREARLRDPAGNRLILYAAGENRRFPPWRIA